MTVYLPLLYSQIRAQCNTLDETKKVVPKKPFRLVHDMKTTMGNKIQPSQQLMKVN